MLSGQESASAASFSRFAPCSLRFALLPKRSSRRDRVLSSGSSAPLSESLLGEFRKLGYVEGQNITFENRFADNNQDRLSLQAVDLVGLKVDVLLAASTTAALAAKNATRSIPIVFSAAG